MAGTFKAESNWKFIKKYQILEKNSVKNQKLKKSSKRIINTKFVNFSKKLHGFRVSYDYKVCLQSIK